MAELRKCPSCGGLTKEKGHLCSPQPVVDKCAYCDALAPDARHVCKAKRQRLEWVCDACGRLAEDADLLCQPAAIPG